MLIPLAGCALMLFWVWKDSSELTVFMEYVFYGFTGLLVGTLISFLLSFALMGEKGPRKFRHELEPLFGGEGPALVIEDLDTYKYLDEEGKLASKSSWECQLAREGGEPQLVQERIPPRTGWFSMHFGKVRECSLYAPDSLIERIH